MSRWMAGTSDGLAVRNVTEAFTMLFPPQPSRTPDRAGRTPRPLRRLGDDERRQQPHDRVRRAIHQQPEVERRSDDRQRRPIEIEAPDEPGAAHFADHRVPRGDGAQPALEVRADRGDVRDEVAIDELLEKHQRGAAREQVAAVGAAVIAERRRLRHPLAEERGGDRHARAERLADGHQVRLEPERLPSRTAGRCARGRTGSRRR